MWLYRINFGLMMTLMRSIFLLTVSLLCLKGYSQRKYVASSVLSTGTWYKIAVKKEGIYKIDVSYLNTLGINTSGIASNSIRLFGNSGAILPESNNVERPDDLLENAIQVIDGGDGVFNGSDYFIFYAPGPHQWIKDSINQRFVHQKNLYSDESYYFLSIGGNGKRISSKNSNAQPNVFVTTFNERYFHEVDTINFLKSGKEWYGEEFSNTPGNSVKRSFNITIPNTIATVPLIIHSSVAARSVGANSKFEIRINDQNMLPLVLPAVTGNVLDAFAVQGNHQGQVTSSQSNITLSYTFIPGAFNSQGWLNWFEIFGRRDLSFTATEILRFRDWSSVGTNNIAQFTIKNVTQNLNVQVWEITDPVNPSQVNGIINGTDLIFQNDATRLREYIAFNINNFLIPAGAVKIETQNLHNATDADYLIITHSSLRQEAQRLAQFHIKQYGYKVNITPVETIYNEFASGAPDPTAIRDFVKMYYDKAGSNIIKRPKFLLLFGDASFDYKGRVSNNTNLIPCYQSQNSLDPLTTYTSDDFFGLLDDLDDVNSTSPPGLLDIGIGRLPAQNVVQANNFVNKVINYHTSAALGPWRNQLTFVADDEDNNLHLHDAELLSSTSVKTNPFLNTYKIYLDAHRQESGSGGSRYPEVNKAIIDQTFNGNLIWNYNGHGGSQRLADEAILDRDVIKQFNNPGKLPLFITATCDFAPYDDPTQFSIGENLLVGDEKGVIALTTTTRLVFAFSNRIINNNYLLTALRPDSAGSYLPLGESVRRAKNITYNSSGDIINNRKFTLLGDPAMKLALPEWKVNIKTINGIQPTGTDTLKALEKYSITGEVTNAAGIKLNSFEGYVYPKIYDKEQKIQTNANDPGSFVTTFNQQSSVVFKGKAHVKNGEFNFSFIVPNDINYQAGTGRISLYAENGIKDATGIFTNFHIGGAGNNNIIDKDGPSIKAYLNDEKFVDGGLVNETPVLIVKFADSSGINTVGSGIGHNITLIIDGDERNSIVLNDFYESDVDSYQRGTVTYQLPVLSNGPHTLRIKGWDIANNSNEAELQLVVSKKEQLQLKNVLNYPNPFTTRTKFWFEHNQPRSSLNVLIQLYSMSGKLVHQIQRIINNDGNRSDEIEWDGKDIYNNKLARGVYIYKISVTGSDGKTVAKMEKLYLL